MKNISIAAVIAFLVVGGGFAFWKSTSEAGPRTDNQQVVNAPPETEQTTLETTAAMKAEEAKFRTYVGDDYDRYYIANMIGHHQGAVDMANVALTNAKHAELKALANNIINAQNKEITTMLDWQSSWGYPASSGEMMVDHSAMNMMEDMDVLIQELKNKTGDDFDKSFLRMMIEHHESAVAMSRPAADNAKHQELKVFAASVMVDQTKEVLQMRNWYNQWGYQQVSTRLN